MHATTGAIRWASPRRSGVRRWDMARAKNGIPVQAEPVKRDLGPLPENFPGVLLTALAVENVGGVGDFKVTLGAVTVLAGPNGAGKTTVLDAARALLIGGRTDGMLQVGATRGQVRGRLSNGWKVERVFLPGRSTVRVWNEKDVELESPGQRLGAGFGAGGGGPGPAGGVGGGAGAGGAHRGGGAGRLDARDGRAPVAAGQRAARLGVHGPDLDRPGAEAGGGGGGAARRHAGDGGGPQPGGAGRAEGPGRGDGEAPEP